MGKVHEYLASFADVEWAALRPTWFMGMYCSKSIAIVHWG